MRLLRSSDNNATFAPEDGKWVVLADHDSAADDLGQDASGVSRAVSLSLYKTQPELWNRLGDDWTLLIEPADELVDLSADLREVVLARPEILVSFPVYTDGRGYSHAATLRQHYGYGGGLIAIGDVRRDQLDFMRHSGFTAFEITGNDSVEDMLASLGELTMPTPHRLYSGAAL